MNKLQRSRVAIVMAQTYAEALIALLGEKACAVIGCGATDPGDYIDDNVVLAQVFETLLDRPVTLPSDVEEGRATLEQEEEDLEIWNEAVSLFRRFLPRPPRLPE